MKIFHLTLLLLAIAFIGGACERRPQSTDGGAEDGKVRPEVAAAGGAPSPSPTSGTIRNSPAPSP
ncbi:MAG TPA: hypothetical protein VLO30_08595 [Chthoniobacterales bacterium]|nr:hypothetical protein [Chthoniobacterales bacterium]